MTDRDVSNLRPETQPSARIAAEEARRRVAAANQNSAVLRFIQIIMFMFGVVEVLLAVRVVLHALGANESNAFANTINSLSQPFIALFANLFSNPMLSASAVLELTTVIAMVVYAVIAWLVARIIWLALSRPR